LLLRKTILLVLLLPAGFCAGAESPFNVDVDLGWGGCYRPREWTPAVVSIHHNLTNPFGGFVSISAAQDELTHMSVVQPFVLTPDLSSHVRVQMKLAFAAERGCEVKILDQRGRTQWQRRYDPWAGSDNYLPMTAVMPNEMLIGIVGRGGFGLLSLDRHAKCATGSDGPRGEIYVRRRLPRMLPWDWTGYVSLDLLVLYDPPWEQINTDQGRAIARWVSNGGKLLIVLGRRPVPTDHPLSDILPAQVGPVRQVELTWPSKTRLNAWQLQPRPGVTVVATDDLGADQTIWTAGMSEFGRVGLLALDPEGLPSASERGQAEFWVRLLKDLRQPPRDDAVGRTISLSREEDVEESTVLGYGYEILPEVQHTNDVLEELMNIEQLRPLSIWWVIGLLTGLAVLLGPVDYFVLKRLDRQPLTWLTSTLIIGVFTVGAYHGVTVLRAGQTQMRVVSVTDAIGASDEAWTTTFAGIFASHSDDYALEQLSRGQWWSPIAPESGYYYGQSGMALRRIRCFQAGGSNLPHSVPINIWSMQCLMCESRQGQLPFDAAVSRRGEDLSIRVRNRSDHDIEDWLVATKQGVRTSLPRIPPGEQRKLRFHPVRRSGRATDRWDSYDAACLARGVLPRTRGMEAYLEQGAVMVCAEYNDWPTDFGLKERDAITSHTHLARLVVFPQEVERDD